jgi:hypothetical protein
MDLKTVSLIPRGRKSQDVLKAMSKISARNTAIAARVVGQAAMSFANALKVIMPDFSK